jgi:hypothetical protein
MAMSRTAKHAITVGISLLVLLDINSPGKNGKFAQQRASIGKPDRGDKVVGVPRQSPKASELPDWNGQHKMVRTIDAMQKESPPAPKG